VENNNINERWNALKENIITAATEMLGKVSRDKKENWFDEEFRNTRRPLKRRLRCTDDCCKEQ
jgi:hypothetical protein